MNEPNMDFGLMKEIGSMIDTMNGKTDRSTVIESRKTISPKRKTPGNWPKPVDGEIGGDEIERETIGRVQPVPAQERTIFTRPQPIQGILHHHGGTSAQQPGLPLG